MGKMKKENGYDDLIKALEPFETIYLRRFDDAYSTDCVGKFDKNFEDNTHFAKREYDNIPNDFYCSPQIPSVVKTIAEKAIRFTEKYQINSEIVYFDSALFVTIKFERCIFVSDKWNELIELYSLSDCAYYTTEKERPYEIIIRLVYNMDNCAA